MNLVEELQSAFRLYNAGEYAAADALCAKARAATPQGQVDVLRLSGMVARKQGRSDAAKAFYEHALRLAPDHHETLNVFGLLKQDLGELGDAARLFEASMRARPGYLPAARNLSRAWLESGRGADAVALWQAMVRSNPGNVTHQLELARALIAAGQSGRASEVLKSLANSSQASEPVTRKDIAKLMIEAGAAEAAIRSLGDDEEGAEARWLRMQALVRLQHHDAALDLGRDILQSTPASVEVLKLCAQLLWMMGRGDEIAQLFEGALSSGEGREAVYLQYIRVLSQMREFDDALAVARRALEQHGQSHWINYLVADVFIELGRAEDALEPACRASEGAAGDVTLLCNEARALTMLGRVPDALAIVDQALSRRPNDQFWIAMQATGLRQTDPKRYAALSGYTDYVRPFMLEPPTGFESMDVFNTALLERLDALHAFSQAPLDQSLRGGSQTSVDLKSSSDPVLRAFFKTIEQPINEYMTGLPRDASHPLLRRNTGRYAISGAWSVKLRGGGGHHVSHVHPEGWLSSAYYVGVPDAVRGADDYEGWLEFGRPPFSIPGMDTAEHRVEPQPGCLALFPSYLWHGTVPIKSGLRTTIAFDVVPV